MRRLNFAPVHLDLSIAADNGLREIERVVVVFGVAEDNRNVVGRGALANRVHLGGVPAERVFHILGDHFEVDWTLPVCFLLA